MIMDAGLRQPVDKPGDRRRVIDAETERVADRRAAEYRWSSGGTLWPDEVCDWEAPSAAFSSRSITIF
jgi:hypothetical protein